MVINDQELAEINHALQREYHGMVFLKKDGGNRLTLRCTRTQNENLLRKRVSEIGAEIVGRPLNLERTEVIESNPLTCG